MNKKYRLIFIFCCFISVAYSQEKFSLNDFFKFSKFSSYSDYEKFSIEYHYTLFNSNLAEKYDYDELGFITRTKLKKFNHLKNNDSLLFNKFFKIFADGKRTNESNNHLSFYKNSVCLLIKFSTTSRVVGYNYLIEFMQECRDGNFKNISCDTAYESDSDKIDCEFKKGVYSIKCSVRSKNDYNGKKQKNNSVNTYEIVFIKKFRK